jgi:hypothetical protein
LALRWCDKILFAVLLVLGLRSAATNASQQRSLSATLQYEDGLVAGTSPIATFQDCRRHSTLQLVCGYALIVSQRGNLLKNVR